LLKPVVLLWSAEAPLAVLEFPVVLVKRAKAPLAVFKLPVVLFWSTESPTAVLKPPALLSSALLPRTVLKLPKQPSRQTARACGESAKQASRSGMRSKPHRGGKP